MSSTKTMLVTKPQHSCRRNMNNEKNNEGCRCGAPVRIIDMYGSGATVFCDRCERYSLALQTEAGRQVIYLSDFHVKRGNQPGQRSLHDLKIARSLFDCLLRDVWPPAATIMDFGIDTDRHLGALQQLVRWGFTSYDLDRVLGDGAAITQLVQCMPEQLYGEVVFRTRYDGLVPEPSEVG